MSEATETTATVTAEKEEKPLEYMPVEFITENPAGSRQHPRRSKLHVVNKGSHYPV